MPLLPAIGRRRPAARLLVAGVYALLLLGGVTMVYPFLLMVAASTTGEPDFTEFRLVPRWLYDDQARFARFLEAKYQQTGDLRARRAQPPTRFADATLPDASERDSAAAARVEAWRSFQATLEPRAFGVWHVGRATLAGKAELLWRDDLAQRVGRDPGVLHGAIGHDVAALSEVFAPFEQPDGRLWPGVAGGEGKLWDQFKRTLDPRFRRPIDGTLLWRSYLHQKYERPSDLAAATGLIVEDFQQITLPATRPDDPRLRADWDHFIANRLPFHTLALADGDARYRAFLEAHGRPTTDATRWPPQHPDADELDLVSAFLRTAVAPADVTIATPDLRFAARHGGARPPYEAEDWWEFNADRGQWLWWFLTRNYAEVIDYVAVRGRSLWNTVVLVVLMMAGALIVNPMAGYALSRFALPYGNQVLLFLLATMAFPYEVTMIPSFLLLRRFPLWPGTVGLTVAAVVVVWLVRRRTGVPLALVLGGAAGLIAARLTILMIGVAAGDEGAASVSLLNTFAALVLPALASGYSIFLLKGFFDSLPEELFEAARIDGASEMRMLWQIAAPLSLPILAVIALFTFTAAYGSYLWALVVCQDDRMWTLMVHLFQMQQWAPPYVTMAANVLASLPTLAVFIVAQNLIMRGIIIPAYK